MNEVLDIPIDTLFQFCFTDSPVFRRFLDARKTFGKSNCPYHLKLTNCTAVVRIVLVCIIAVIHTILAVEPNAECFT